MKITSLAQRPRRRLTLLQRASDYFEGLFDLRPGNVQWRQETDDTLAGRDGKQSGSHQLFHEGNGGILIARIFQLDTDHQADGPYFAHTRAIECAKPVAKLGALHGGVLAESLSLDDLQDLERGSATNGISSVSRAVSTRSEQIAKTTR
jgi:hypothetical protein